jgi:putative ABC transport system permease protein
MMGVLGRLLRRRRLEVQLDAELRDHLERQTADYVRDGLSEAEARRRAQLELGGFEQVKEACRDARGTRLVEDLGQDLRYGARVLRKSPVFTLVAALSLALGIGANTAIFTLVDSLVLRALPVRNARQLVRLEGGSWTNPIWEQIRERQHGLFDGAMACSDTRFDLSPGGESEFVQGIWASGGFFDVLGVSAILGRTFTPEDDRRDGGPEGPVAVISYAFWQRRYGGAADAVGRALVLNGVPFTVIGVTPPGFFGTTVGRSYDVAAPIGMVDRLQHGGDSQLDGRSFWWLEIFARLKPGQTLEAATQALRGVQPQIREATKRETGRPEDQADFLRDGLTLAAAANGFSEVRGRYAKPLLTLMVVVGLVLLIACANLASLQVARANARRRELSARLALGASRSRLARQLLSENLLLAVPGALLGLAFARWGSRLLVGQISGPEALVFLDLSLHYRVLAFTLAVTIGTTLLFGIVPALRAGRVPPADAIKQQGAGLAGEGTGALGGPLVVIQVALSLVLLFGAGLFVRTFTRLAHLDLGLDDTPLLLVSLDAQRSVVPASGRAALYARAQEAVRALPGVAGAAVSAIAPLSGMGWKTRFQVKGRPKLANRESEAWVNAVTPGFFTAYGTPLLAGRDFDRRDGMGAQAVAIVNEAFVRRFLSAENALGRQLVRESEPGLTPPPAEIVGVAKDAVYRSPREPIPPTVYLSLAQMGPDMWPFASLTLRAATGSPALLAKAVTSELATVDPRLSLSFRLLSDDLRSSLMGERLLAMLSAFFGGLALLLAGMGLYGVTSYGVSRRRTEIGVRMALGAEASGVIRLVLGQAVRLVALGLVIGTGFSLWASRFVSTLLFGLEPYDPATLAGAAAVLTAISLVAAGLPARRASQIDPAQVLREG